MTVHNRVLGKQGENLAADFLKNKGYAILDKNFRNKCGEIDLVAHDGKMMVFVEVKCRQSLAFGLPQESVHYLKQRKIIRVALSYLKFRYGTVDVMFRFDVVSIHQNPNGYNHIEHFPNAFEAPGFL